MSPTIELWQFLCQMFNFSQKAEDQVTLVDFHLNLFGVMNFEHELKQPIFIFPSTPEFLPGKKNVWFKHYILTRYIQTQGAWLEGST